MAPIYDYWPSDETQCTATFPGIPAYRCQRAAGHEGTHRMAMPWSSSRIAEWPAKTSTTCGDV